MLYYTTIFIVMIQKIMFAIILFGDNRPTAQEKFIYLLKVLISFGPIAYIMNALNVWFLDNQQFFSFLILSLTVNILVGAWYHKYAGSFKWALFFRKNIQMWLIILVVYPLLEALSITAGDNIVGQGFKIMIQLATLLYPISKVFKNAYILSKRKFPPAFIMERIYDFEKTGDLSNFDFKKENESYKTKESPDDETKN